MIKLYNGDCLEIMNELIEDGVKVDAIITDPPYGMNFQSHRRKNVYNRIENDSSINWLEEFVSKSEKIMVNNSSFYCFCSWHKVDIFKTIIEKYFKIKNIIVWVKNNHGSGDLKASYAPKHEFIIYANKGRCQFENGRKEDVIFYNKTGNKVHPTQKPVDMLEFFITNSSKKNDLILDPFMGSGTTGVACKNLNRDFIGIELDKNYFEIAKNRIGE